MARFKTLQFPNTAAGQADKIKALEWETTQGWKVVSETIIPGKFDGQKACCFYLICAPCAFLAGHKADIIQVTFEKPDQVIDAIGHAPAPQVEVKYAYDRQKWLALVEYDADIAAAEAAVRPYGEKWVDQLASGFMALKDKTYLDSIVEKVKAAAQQELRVEEAAAAQRAEMERVAAAEEAERRSRAAALGASAMPSNEAESAKSLWHDWFWGTPTRQTIAVVVVALLFLAMLGWFASSPAPAPDKSSSIKSDLPALSSSTSTNVIEPSFDCGRVHSAVLKLVCSTPELATDDQQLAEAYARAKSLIAIPNELKLSQRAWIKERNNSSADVPTIRALYQRRLDYLKSVVQNTGTDNSGTNANEGGPTPDSVVKQYSYIVGLDQAGDNWLALRSEPSGVLGSRIQRLGPDVLMTVTETQGRWSHVRTMAGDIGWVDSDYIRCCKTE